LAEKEMEAKKLKYRLEGLVSSLRDQLDPFERVEELKGEIIAEQALEFAKLQIEYRGALKEIKAIKKAIGG